MGELPIIEVQKDAKVHIEEEKGDEENTAINSSSHNLIGVNKIHPEIEEEN